ncbi:MAG: putative toxin-antitoxin system toxin component, PIN family [Bacteroidales bacterium]|nr:putative toxin-antitoxin system toxin component, PIN family [Bacteroidales bacterium]
MQKEVFILDSNIWISYVITKRLNTLVTLIHNHQLTVLTSKYLVEEIQEVLSRSKFKKYLKHSDIKEVIAIHLKLCRFVGTDETTNLLTDPKDNFLLN